MARFTAALLIEFVSTALDFLWIGVAFSVRVLFVFIFVVLRIVISVVWCAAGRAEDGYDRLMRDWLLHFHIWHGTTARFGLLVSTC